MDISFSTSVVCCCNKETVGSYTLKGKHQDILCTQSSLPVGRDRPLTNSISCKRRAENKPVKQIVIRKRATGTFLPVDFLRAFNTLKHTVSHTCNNIFYQALQLFERGVLHKSEFKGL